MVVVEADKKCNGLAKAGQWLVAPSTVRRGEIVYNSAAAPAFGGGGALAGLRPYS